MIFTKHPRPPCLWFSTDARIAHQVAWRSHHQARRRQGRGQGEGRCSRRPACLEHWADRHPWRVRDGLGGLGEYRKRRHAPAGEARPLGRIGGPREAQWHLEDRLVPLHTGAIGAVMGAGVENPRPSSSSPQAKTHAPAFYLFAWLPAFAGMTNVRSVPSHLPPASPKSPS